MSLPNMRRTVLSFGQQVVLRKHTQSIVNHIPTFTYVDSDIVAAIQPANAEELELDNIDKNKRYISVFSVNQITINDLIGYKDVDYKIISSEDYSDYGYYELIGAEIKL